MAKVKVSADSKVTPAVVSEEKAARIAVLQAIPESTRDEDIREELALLLAE